MMKSRLSLALLSVSGLLLMAELNHAQHPEKTVAATKFCYLPKEEVDVYATYLGGEASSNILTVLVTRTDGYIDDVDGYNLRLAAQGHGIPPEVREDFTRKNKSSCVIQPFGGVPNLRFISKSEERNIFAVGWSEFHKKYGKGSAIVTVSRVGFNTDKTLALLHILGASGHNAAAGELLLLERKNSKWVIKFHIQTMAV
jgi:hypothetical protein